MQKWQWHKLRNIWCGAHSNTGNPDGVPTVFKMVTFIQERMYCKENNANQIISIKGSYWSCFYVDKSFKKKSIHRLFSSKTQLWFWHSDSWFQLLEKVCEPLVKHCCFFCTSSAINNLGHCQFVKKNKKNPKQTKKNPITTHKCPSQVWSSELTRVLNDSVRTLPHRV